MMRFHALGGVAVSRDGQELNVGGPRQRRLLAMLLIHRNAVVSADRLVDAVFAGEPTPAAATTLRSYVARVRRVVETKGSAPVLATLAPGYVLRLADDDFDVAGFEAAVVEGRSLLSRGEPGAAVTVLREGLALWRGDPYAEFDDEDWVRPEAQRLVELELVAHEVLFEAELAAGQAATIVPELETMAAQHPLRETFVAQLMTALYRCGRQADALRAYRHHHDVLVDELGLDPTPALRELEERILAQDADLLGTEPGTQAVRGYRLGERLGTGRDGTVYATHLPGVERDLVVRVYRAELADAPEFIRHFEASAQRLAALHHPAIVPIHDHWREPGAAYLVMRRMHGGSLADRIERLARRPLTVDDVSAIVRRVGGALAAARDAGVMHGRVDPGSVLFDERGDAWLSDFELAAGSGERTAIGDVTGLAALLAACLPSATGPVADVIERGLWSSPDLTVERYVEEVEAALVGEPEHPTATAPNPYKGLRAFDESDAADFFGRGALVDALVDRLGHDDVEGRLVLVVGGSGTGKSSAVRAGLLPRLRRGDVDGSDQWFVTTMLPGATPFKELAGALRRVAATETSISAQLVGGHGGIDAATRALLPPGGQLLLVIDQFEELFTSAPEQVQRRFLDGLVHALAAPDSRLRVVATIRADFYDRPLAFHPFGALVRDATVTIHAMSPAELEEAIVEPALRVGRQVERALVAELVNATFDEPAGLPALQFTLFELAEAADGGDLTLARYRELGGMSGAIASRAESLYRSLDDDERIAVRRLFSQLVVVTADGGPTRRRAIRTELTAGDAELDALIDRWADARLLSLDRHRQSRLPTVEPAHEALLREWPRLRRWIEVDRQALLVHGQLREAAAAWTELGRDPGALYRGLRLQAALDTLGSRPLAPQDQEFVDASVTARAEEEDEASTRIQRQVRANQRLRRQLVVIGVALVAALIGGVMAVDQRAEAVDERRAAFARELASAAAASLDEDPERSTLLALEAVDVARDGGSAALPDAVGALHEAISRSRVLLTIPAVGGGADWSSDGSLIVTEGPEETGIIDVRDAETGESVRSWKGHEIDVNEVAFSPDGRMLATGGDDGYLRVWDTASGEEIAAFRHAGATTASAPAFSPDGRLVAAHWSEATITKVFDLETGETVAETYYPQTQGNSFSHDGRRLVLASLEEPGIYVINATTGERVVRAGEDMGPARDAKFSPDGRWLASAHEGGTVRIWKAKDFSLRSTITAHRSEATAVAWSRDSKRLATASTDGTARVHDMIPGGTREAVVVSARDTANGIAAVAFSPDGERLMTSDLAISSVKIWDIGPRAGAELVNIPTVALGRGSGQFVAGDRTVVAVGADGAAGRWDVESGNHLGRFDVGEERGTPLHVAVSPDGSLLATGLEEGVRIWDLSSGELVGSVGLNPDGEPNLVGYYIDDIVWSPDSEHLAVSRVPHDRALITVVDRTGATVAELEEDPWTTVPSMAFTTDGTALVMARTLPTPHPSQRGLRTWQWQEDQIVLEVEGLFQAVAVDPSGDRVVAARAFSDAAHVYDLESGKQLRTLRGAGTVFGVSYSADGERVAMSGADGTVRIFDADDGRLELILRGHDRAVNEAWFSPEGTRLASLDEAGMVRVWALDPDELVEIGRSRITRDLDDAECRQYLRRATCGAA